GQKAGLEKLNVKAEKEEIENQFNRWVNADPARKEKYGEALSLIKNATGKRAEYANAQQYISECFSQGCEILQLSQVASALIGAMKTADQKRLADLSDNIRKNISESFYKDYSAPTDKKAVKAMMKLYRADVPAKFHPDFYANIVDKKFKGDVDKFVDDMFDRSIFSDQARLLAFLDKPNLKVLESDPVYITSNSISKISSEVGANLRQYDPDLTKGRRLWMAALMEMAPDKTRYPDANSTMRLTYGQVLDYDPRDGVTYKYYTTLKGVMEKYKPGDYEFDVPQRLIDLYDRKEYGRYASPKGYLPVCFTTNNDITGGNSGSPVLNGSGELIGLAFDGNWEAMSGDVAFEPDLQRTIVVDIRYVLWVMDIYAGARHLVDEMTVVM
ncbi:MAG TPA: S46 family peptidase, partial [Bacteroidales bacterium]|nr:S46 family peptidase [Bacteroidales bacterium]